jgi:hypothetical protein
MVARLRLKFALTGSSDLDLSKFVKSSVVSVTVLLSVVEIGVANVD